MRRSALVLLPLLALAGVAPDAAGAATIQVTTRFDGLGNNAAACTLREAVQAANTDTAVDGCPAGSGADEILLAVNTTYELSLSDTAPDNTNQTGDLDVTSDVTVRTETVLGSIFYPWVDGSDIDRVFHVLADGSLRLEKVKVRNGTPLEANGGCISSSGHLELVDATVASCDAVNGGGIYLLDGTATITRSLIDSNTANGAGGGIGQASAHDGLVIEQSSIRRNDALQGVGGGLSGDWVEIADSLFELNTATVHGGGAYIDLPHPEQIVNTTFSANSAGNSGGGLFVAGPDPGFATLANLTIVGNEADADADGVGGGGGFGGHRITLANSILAGNLDLTPAGGESHPDCSGLVIFSQGYNILGIQGDFCNLNESTPTSQVGSQASPIDPLVEAVANNGGPTRTRALLAGSPAIDAGDPAGCAALGGLLLTDQRLYGPRASDGNGDGVARCDVGAYELGATALLFADGFESGDLGQW